jgi:hypothetical protein
MQRRLQTVAPNPDVAMSSIAGYAVGEAIRAA